MIRAQRLAELDDAERARLLDRGVPDDPAVDAGAAATIDEVRRRGDAALRDHARRFDRVELDTIEVPRAGWDAALEGLERGVRSALTDAADSIRRFHEAQRPRALELENSPGVRLGRRPDPLRRVGVYAPGGRAAYASSVLMGAVPARVAGVGEVVVCSPPALDGRPSPLVMAACAIAGADRLCAVGGAAAVAALAYGTASVPRVDRIVGPGNRYVTAAKRRVAAVVGTDAPAGPSELLVVADGSADAEAVALEMIAQAEHDPDAAVVLVATERALAESVAAELERRARAEPRAEIVRAALARRAALLVADSLDDALGFAEEYAPEHLLLLVEQPRAALERCRCAGTVCLGPASSVAFGDYATGANHVLPTGGLARSYSGLSTQDFVRWTTWQEVAPAAAPALAGIAAVLAGAEGLPAHAAAARRAARTAVRGPRFAVAAEAADGSAPAAGEPPLVGAEPLLAAGAQAERGDPRVGPDAAPNTAPGTAANAGTRKAGDHAPLPRVPYRSLRRYDPRRPALDVDLSANTNLWGSCPPALAALHAARPPTAYPSPYAAELRAALAEMWNVSPAQVTTGCGSDDLIDSAIRAFCEAGAAVAFPSPTFPMADLFTRMNGARPLPVRLDAAGEPTEEALDALCGADVVYLCRPNNPTGGLLPRGAVLRVLAEARGLVLIDEAYGEYAGETLVGDAVASGRAVVLRTFSKAYGLAGLRVGYALGPEPLIRAIELSRGPYKVAAAAECAAIAAVREGRAWVDDVVSRTARSRTLLGDALRSRGLRVYSSAANFLLVAPGPAGAGQGGGDGEAARDGAPPGSRRDEWAALVKAALAERGIGVRGFEALPGIGDAIRVTVGPWDLMERFLAALDAALLEPAAQEPEPGGAHRREVRA